MVVALYAVLVCACARIHLKEGVFPPAVALTAADQGYARSSHPECLAPTLNKQSCHVRAIERDAKDVFPAQRSSHRYRNTARYLEDESAPCSLC